MIGRMAIKRHFESASDLSVTVLAAMAFLLPAMGSGSETLAQDTLKSAIAAFGILFAALAFFRNGLSSGTVLLWHHMLFVPLALAVYSLGSIYWSHGYLAAVESIRWILLALLGWLGLNAITPKNLPRLLWGVHGGLVVASIWAILQFWLGFSLFAQGPQPASTFYNRNFFGEYAVCALPFSAWLLCLQRSPKWALVLAVSIACEITAILMTGTRSALVALSLTAPLQVIAAVRYRSSFPLRHWTISSALAVATTGVCSLVLLVNVPTTVPDIAQDRADVTAWNHGAARVASMGQRTEYTEGSFSVRSQMWRATLRMMMESPLTGVGAGAWEVHIPKYQHDDTLLEIDYYAHNEYLQLLSEFGLPVGGLTLAFLAAYWIHSARSTLRAGATTMRELGLRYFSLTSLLAMGIVSTAGFPWHLAGCGVLLALSLSMLFGSDIRSRNRFGSAIALRHSSRAFTRIAVVSLVLALLAAVYFTQRAMRAERSIVQALFIAKNLGRSPPAMALDMRHEKERMLSLIREGIELNPHYRKLTPIMAEFLMAEGDWANAAAILKSVTDSRPHVAALWKGQALAYAQLHQNDTALHALGQVQMLRPETMATKNLEIVILANTGQELQAAQMVRSRFAHNDFDYEMVQAGYALGLKIHDDALAIQSLELRNQIWPEQAADGYFRIGKLMSSSTPSRGSEALQAFANGLARVPIAQQESYIAQVPQPFRNTLSKKKAAYTAASRKSNSN